MSRTLYFARTAALTFTLWTISIVAVYQALASA